MTPMYRTDRRMFARVWQIAWPVMLSNVTTPLLGMVDTAVVGRLPGPEHIGGVAVGAMVFTSIFWAFGFLRMGTTGFVAQAQGAEDGDEIRAVLARSLLIAVVLGAVLAAVQVPAWALARQLMDASPTVEPLAADYFAIRAWSGPATLANYALLGWFIGMQRTRTALVLQIWLNGTNIILDLVFVLGLDMGVPGVALATLIGEYSAAGLGLVLAARVLRPLPGGFRRDGILDPARIRPLLLANFDIFLRTACLVLAFAWFTRAGGRLGDLALAGNAVLMQMVHLVAFGLDGFAFAAEALVGSAIGRRDLAGLRQAVWASTVWALIVALAIALAFALGGDWVIALMTDQAPVRAAAETYLFWVAIYPLVAIWCFQLDGIFIGATRTAEMRNGMALSLAAFALAILVLPDVWGNHGLWASLTVLNVVRTVTLLIWYRRIEGAAVSATSPAAAR